MSAPFVRQTLQNSVQFSGVGIHTGRQATVRVHPYESGIWFQVKSDRWQARWDSVKETVRCTTLGAEGETVSTVEHLLSALYGLKITDALIEVEGVEIPILDGSALPFVEAFNQVGFAPLKAGARYRLGKPVSLYDGDRYVAAFPGGQSVSGLIHFDHPQVGVQNGTYSFGAESYTKQIAPARTFGFDYEVKALLEKGLALGGALENALIISEQGYSTPLRFEQELLRHKLLDLLGDWSLIGVFVDEVSFVAVKSGHALNVALAKEAAQSLERMD